MHAAGLFMVAVIRRDAESQNAFLWIFFAANVNCAIAEQKYLCYGYGSDKRNPPEADASEGSF